MKKNEVIVGFDISSTVVGWCVLDSLTGELLEEQNNLKTQYSMGNLRFIFSDEMLDKANNLETFVEQLSTKYNIKRFYLEDRLKAFQIGHTNAEALFKTAAMNFLCQYLFHKRNIPVVAINVNTARGAVVPGFHKIARQIKGVKHKDIIFEMAAKILSEKVGILPTKILKSGKNKGKTVFIDEAKDMVDAWVIAKAGFNIVNSKIPA
jgi:hypothetical protein